MGVFPDGVVSYSSGQQRAADLLEADLLYVGDFSMHTAVVVCCTPLARIFSLPHDA